MPAELAIVLPACIAWCKQQKFDDPRHWEQDLMKKYGRPTELDIRALENSQEMKKIKSCKRERVVKVEIEKLLISEFSLAVASSVELVGDDFGRCLTLMNPFSICKELLAAMFKKFPHSDPSNLFNGIADKIDYCDPLNYNVGGIGRRMRKFLLFRIHQLMLLANDCNNNKAVEIDENQKLSEQFAELILPVTNFHKIFQQFDTQTMIEIFANLNHSTSSPIEQSQSQSRLPTALVKIVNNYCELDPSSSADDQLITRNLLQ